MQRREADIKLQEQYLVLHEKLVLHKSSIKVHWWSPTWLKPGGDRKGSYNKANVRIHSAVTPYSVMDSRLTVGRVDSSRLHGGKTIKCS